MTPQIAALLKEGDHIRYPEGNEYKIIRAPGRDELYVEMIKQVFKGYIGYTAPLSVMHSNFIKINRVKVKIKDMIDEVPDSISDEAS